MTRFQCMPTHIVGKQQNVHTRGNKVSSITIYHTFSIEIILRNYIARDSASQQVPKYYEKQENGNHSNRNC